MAVDNPGTGSPTTASPIVESTPPRAIVEEQTAATSPPATTSSTSTPTAQTANLPLTASPEKESAALPLDTASPLPPARPTLSVATPSAAAWTQDTPAPLRVSTPSAPSKAPPAISLTVAPDVAEFDPFATPAPSAPAPKEIAEDVQQTPGPASREENQDGGRRSLEDPRTPRRRRHSTSGSGEAGDVTGSGAGGGEPAFNFAGFLKDLRTKPADPIARYLKSFLTNFSKKPFTVNEQIKLIRDFLAFIASKMAGVEPWKSQSPAELDNALEAMEKLVMNRLYPYTFTPQLTMTQTITTDDLERDAVFAQRVRLFGWVREKHLDVPEGENSQGFLGFAEQELLKINHYKAPRDKMICILNCCKVIFGLIRHTMGNEGGADAFVPILIFVVLRASPDNMLSNVEYINRFRNPEKLQGEAGYYLSSLSGAIAFIETMDASSLSNITQEEFESNVEKAIQQLPASPSSPRASQGRLGGGGSDMSPFATSPGEEPARQLALPATAAALDGTKRFFQRTGDAAKEAVSRPLGAIGKIFDSMQHPMEGYDSDSGDEQEGTWSDERRREQEARHRHGNIPAPVPVPPGLHDPPSRLFQQLGMSPSESRVGSERPTPYSGSPRESTPDYYYQHQQQQQEMQHTLEASNEAYAREQQREQARAANVLTLHQMFPALDEEIVDAVLYSCGEDLGLAIDRLLEM